MTHQKHNRHDIQGGTKNSPPQFALTMAFYNNGNRPQRNLLARNSLEVHHVNSEGPPQETRSIQ